MKVTEPVRSLYRVSHHLLDRPFYVVAETPLAARRHMGITDDAGAVQCIAEIVKTVGLDAPHAELEPVPISVLPSVPPTPIFDPAHDAAPTCTVCAKGKCYHKQVHPGYIEWVCPHCCQSSGYSRMSTGKEVI